MALTLLCAGCSQAERDEAEATVRAALGERSRHQPWVVSLVKVGGSWSITVDGPDLHALSFMAPGPRLGESIQERLRPNAPAPAPSRAPAPPPAAPAQTSSKAMRDRHECRSCRRPFVVIYEQEAEEAQELASIACPHCWQNNQVMVAEAATYTQAYRAEKLEA
jgi:hypothetical protein